METQIVTRKKKMEYPELHQLVSHVIGQVGGAAVDNKCRLINDVPGEIGIEIDEALMTEALSNLLKLVVTHSANSNIRITAKFFGNVILMHVKDDGNLDYDTVSTKINRLQFMAEKLGGFVGFTSYRNKLTTIAFSFINSAVAA
jgi:hypothetical protein